MLVNSEWPNSSGALKTKQGVTLGQDPWDGLYFKGKQDWNILRDMLIPELAP